MSKKKNKKIVKQVYQYFKEGQLDKLYGLLADDIVWILPKMPKVPFSGKCQGIEQVTQFFEILAETQDSIEFNPIEFIAQKDYVVALGRFNWQVKSTGKSYESDWAQVFKLRNGRITRFQEFADTSLVVAAFS